MARTGRRLIFRGRVRAADLLATLRPLAKHPTLLRGALRRPVFRTVVRQALQAKEQQLGSREAARRWLADLIVPVPWGAVTTLARHPKFMTAEGFGKPKRHGKKEAVRDPLQRALRTLGAQRVRVLQEDIFVSAIALALAGCDTPTRVRIERAYLKDDLGRVLWLRPAELPRDHWVTWLRQRAYSIAEGMVLDRAHDFRAPDFQAPQPARNQKPDDAGKPASDPLDAIAEGGPIEDLLAVRDDCAVEAELIPQSEPKPERPLSPQMDELLDLEAAGLPSAEIARRLGITMGALRGRRHRLEARLRRP
jgi:hypothetical protein